MDEQVSRIDAARDRISARRPRSTTGRAVRTTIGLILVAAIAFGLYRYHPWTLLAGGSAGGARNPRARGDAPQAVGVATVGTGDLPIELNALGTVTPLATVTVQTQINGLLMEVGYKEGQMVHRGDFLAQIDPRPYQAALASAQGTLAKDQAVLRQAQVDLARYQTLNRQDSIARQTFEDQVWIVHQDEGTVQVDQAAVDTQKLNLSYCRIVSPIDGRVGLRLVDAGNYVQTGSSTGLVVVTQTQPITVIFTLPEDALPAVLKRVHAGASLPVTVLDRSNTTQLGTGTLETVDNQVDTTTGTVKLRASFANADETLFPSQFVNTKLLVDTLHDAVVIPNAAIQTGAPGTYVYLLNANNTVSVRPVKTGPTDGQKTAITSGLAAGDKIVIDGVDRLRDGAPVMVPAATAAAPGAGDETPARSRRGGPRPEGERSGGQRQRPAPAPAQ
jgi:multidrug efflux system membrane fusion protein